jgi:hypothetical protein
VGGAAGAEEVGRELGRKDGPDTLILLARKLYVAGQAFHPHSVYSIECLINRWHYPRCEGEMCGSKAPYLWRACLTVFYAQKYSSNYDNSFWLFVKLVGNQTSKRLPLLWRGRGEDKPSNVRYPYLNLTVSYKPISQSFLLLA